MLVTITATVDVHKPDGSDPASSIEAYNLAFAILHGVAADSPTGTLKSASGYLEIKGHGRTVKGKIVSKF
jgi:hypothetical protein